MSNVIQKADDQTIAAAVRLHGYAGDMTANDAWTRLQCCPDTILVDVRTAEEWQAVGLPELTKADKETVCLPWRLSQSSSEINHQFSQQLQSRIADKNTPIILMCKGGGRSKSAAIAMTQAGYKECYNMLSGFEGGDGWRASQLPCQSYTNSQSKCRTF